MMKMMKKKKSAKKQLTTDRYWFLIFWGLFIVFGLVTVAALFNLLPHKTHDNDYETWLAAFDQLIKAGQWFPNWVKDFWFEHGSALFIVYPPLFFYLAEIPRALGLSLVISVKLVVGLSLLAAFFSMYLLGRELAGPKAFLQGRLAGLIAGLLYLVFPYHFALVYIRGAYSENLAYALIPLFFYFIYRIFRDRRWQNVMGLGGVTAALILTNLPATLLTGVAGLLWVAIWWLQGRSLPWQRLITAGAVGLSLSAWWWYPMWLAKPLIQLDYMISGKFHFSRYFFDLWDYLPSLTWLGGRYIQWGIVAWVVVVMALVYLWRQRTRKPEDYHLVQLLMVKLLLVTALMTAVSYPIWAYLPGFVYIQFPYRFLIVVSLLTALLGAILLPRLNWRWQIVLLAILLLQSAWFARPIFGYRPPIYKNDLAYTIYGDIKSQLDDPKTDRDESGNRIVLLHTAEIGYLPSGINHDVVGQEYYNQISPTLWLLSFEAAARYSVPDDQKIRTPGQLSDVLDTPRSISFTHTYPESARVYYRQFGFPGWQIWIDGRKVSWNDTTGQIDFMVPAGTHRVQIAYTIPPRAITGRVISLLALLGLVWVARRLYARGGRAARGKRLIRSA